MVLHCNIGTAYCLGWHICIELSLMRWAIRDIFLWTVNAPHMNNRHTCIELTKHMLSISNTFKHPLKCYFRISEIDTLCCVCKTIILGVTHLWWYNTAYEKYISYVVQCYSPQYWGQCNASARGREKHVFLDMSRGPFYKHGLTLIPASISNYFHYKVWVKLLIHSQSLTVQTYPCWD